MNDIVFLTCFYSEEMLSDDYVRQQQHFLDWKILSKTQISETIIREFKDKVFWYDISFFQKLSENFIREFKDQLDWCEISSSQKLSENFIREFKDKVNWNNICYKQKLSENFIREFKDKVNWNNICYKQKLSENFIWEFKDKVNWVILSSKMFLSKPFIIKNCYELQKSKTYHVFIYKYLKVVSLQKQILKYLYKPGNSMYLKTQIHFNIHKTVR